MSLMESLVGAETAARAAQFIGLEYGFVLDALLASVIVGIVCGVVGTFLVLEGMSLIGDATGHATLPGVCAAFLVVGAKSMGALLIGALISGFLAAVLIGVLSGSRRSKPDAVIGVVLSVFFGIGIVLLSYVQNSPTAAQSGLQDFLFGNAAGVSRTQLWTLAAVGAVIVAGVAVFFRPLVATTFDADFARSIGVPTGAVRYGLLISLAVAVVISIQAVGVVLVSAMLIIPPSTALLVSKRIGRVVILSGVLGAVSGAGGSFISFIYEGVATGPAMVLTAAALFVLALLAAPRGAVAAWWHRRRRRAEATEVSS